MPKKCVQDAVNLLLKNKVKLKNAKIKRAQELYNQGYIKSEILRMIMKIKLKKFTVHLGMRKNYQKKILMN